MGVTGFRIKYSTDAELRSVRNSFPQPTFGLPVMAFPTVSRESQIPGDLEPKIHIANSDRVQIPTLVLIL